MPVAGLCRRARAGSTVHLVGLFARFSCGGGGAGKATHAAKVSRVSKGGWLLLKVHVIFSRDIQAELLERDAALFVHPSARDAVALSLNNCLSVEIVLHLLAFVFGQIVIIFRQVVATVFQQAAVRVLADNLAARWTAAAASS